MALYRCGSVLEYLKQANLHQCIEFCELIIPRDGQSACSGLDIALNVFSNVILTTF